MSDKTEKNINEENIDKIKKNKTKKDEKIKVKIANMCKECSKKDKLIEELESLKAKNVNLELQISNLKQENIKAQDAFMEQAKTFQDKAKEKVEEFKVEHKEKSNEKISHIKKYSTSKFFKEITEPWLNLHLAVEFGEKQDDAGVRNYVIGFKMLLRQIDSIMESHGLTKIVPKLKEIFNPQTMDAISTINNKELIDKVIEVKKNGFKHHDRIIKPATVVIGK